jgi:hypothetical protein
MAGNMTGIKDKAAQTPASLKKKQGLDSLLVPLCSSKV